MTNSKVMRCFTGSCGEGVFACGDNFYVDSNLTEQHLRVCARIKVGSAVLEVTDVMNDACGKSAQRFGAGLLSLFVHLAMLIRGYGESFVRSSSPVK